MFWSDNQNHLPWRPVESTGYSLLPDPSPRDFKGAALGY
jgi:hypothetical protein